MSGRLWRNAVSIASTAIALGVSGCTQSVDGHAAEPPNPRISFHPCDGFPEEAIVTARLNASPPDRMPERHNPQVYGCGYQSPDSYSGVVISAIAETFSSVESSDRFTVLSETTIGGRPALVSDFRGGSACTVSVAIEPGILEFMIGYSELEEFTTVDAACDQATKVATTLAPYFPDHL
ncbi:DUF3558 domain-containing protein [Rhodococcus sp. MSC1_016]|uniref:DUF3558 domain-containing protein n=1 Tax=Rhodococcus sp. MSC1_016 TaxID=2909266 RepID=UPI0027DFB155|nr:DUF3558 domain-containing protein [Rhodococcus sp. MSC1_016]